MRNLQSIAEDMAKAREGRDRARTRIGRALKARKLEGLRREFEEYRERVGL